MESSNQTAVAPREGGCTLVIMAKAPRLGVVKTRLADSLSPSEVVALYRCLLDDTMALAKSLDSVEVAIMCPASDVEDLVFYTGGAVRVVAQTGAGLAAGLTSVFRHFAQGGHQRVIAFNSDSPHLPASVLQGAFRALAEYDLVVGPTHDGGYYLVGAKAPHAGLFDGDRMGTANALETLLTRARALQLSVGFADPFYDVDVPSDLIRLDEELRQAPGRAPRTAAWFAEWRQAEAQLRPDTGEL